MTDPNRLIQISDLGNQLADGLIDWAPVAAPLVAAGGVMALGGRYQWRRRVERRITGADASLAEIVPTLKLKKGQKASDVNPALPSVRVRKLATEEVIRNLRITAGAWTLITGSTEELHLLTIARSRHGKNETFLDPMVWNAIFRRPEALVVNDVKGAMYDRFHRRTKRRQYRYTFDPRHGSSEAINLVADRRTAEMTATAMYPLGGAGGVYRESARALFLALSEHVGYSSIVDVYRIAADLSRLQELTKDVPAIASIIGGKNEVFAGDVRSALLSPLAPLKDSEVSRVFDSDSGQPNLRRSVLVWIIIPAGLEKSLGPLAGAIIRILYEQAKTIHEVVRFCVDEAGSCLANDDLDQFLAVAGGQGVYFALVFQSRSQLEARIGEKKTNDVLNNAHYHFYGASGDPSTRAYVEHMSGTAEVHRAEYEDYGFARSWKQMFASGGAPYAWTPRDRSRIEPQHMSVPKMWWYVYSGDPARIELLIAPPLYAYEDQIMPPEVRPKIGDRKRRELPPSPEGRQSQTPSSAPLGRECEACGEVTTDAAAVSCRCGSRLPDAGGGTM